MHTDTIIIRPRIPVIGTDAALTFAITSAIQRREQKAAQKRAFWRGLRNFLLNPLGLGKKSPTQVNPG
jgi:hypothetical protein